MPPTTNAINVRSTIFSESNKVLAAPQRRPESPDPTAANVAHVVVAGFGPRRYQPQPSARMPLKQTTAAKKTHHLDCPIYAASTSATKAELATWFANAIGMC